MKTTILLPSQYFESCKPETVFSAEHRAVQETAGLDMTKKEIEHYCKNANKKRSSSSKDGDSE